MLVLVSLGRVRQLFIVHFTHAVCPGPWCLEAGRVLCLGLSHGIDLQVRFVWGLKVIGLQGQFFRLTSMSVGMMGNCTGLTLLA